MSTAASEIQASSSIGAKAALLLQLRSVPALREIVPPLVTVPRELAERWAARVEGADTDPAEKTRRLGQALSGELSTLGARLRSVCGPPPWIVRSSGEEDAADAPRAGAYLSLPCESEGELGATLAAVVLSGLRPATAAGLRSSGAMPGPIAAFIQPLVGTPAPPEENSEAVPLLAPQLLATLRSSLQAIHRHVDSTGLACEWVLDGPEVVSVSTTTVGAAGVSGSISAALGHFVAQHASALHARALWLPGLDLPFYCGGHLRWVGEGSWRLVQVRPATYAADPGLVEGLAAADRLRLVDAGFTEVGPVKVLAPPARARIGRVLRATNLEEAWERYLAAESSLQADIVAVVVELGTPEEHAGLNFLAAGIALLVATASLPDDVVSVVVDVARSSCFVSPDTAPHLRLIGEPVRFVSLPSDAFVLTDGLGDEALHADLVGDLLLELAGLSDGLSIAARTTRGVEAQGLLGLRVKHPQIRRLLEAATAIPASDDVRYGIARRSLLPESGTRCQHPRLGWISPSLFGLALAPVISVKDAPAGLLSRLQGSRSPSDPVRRYVEARVASRNEPGRGLTLRAREALLAVGNRAGRGFSSQLRRIASRSPADDQHLPAEATKSFMGVLDALALHTRAEREDLLDRWLRWLDGLGTEPLRRLLRIDLDPLPAEPRLLWLEWAASDGASAAREIHTAFLGLRGALNAMRTSGVADSVLAAVDRLAGAERDCTSPVSLSKALEPAVIDAFDLGGKHLLRELFHNGSERARLHHRELLFTWIDWLGRLLPGDRALSAYAHWLADHRPTPGEREVLLADRIWSQWREEARRTGEVDLPSLHQLLNVLHQTSLDLPADDGTVRLPGRAARLSEIAAGFTRAPGSVLRHEATRFELERPMGLHKASLVCLPGGRILTEFAEPPNATEGDLGRLQAFSDLLDRFNDWYDLASFTTRRKRDAAVWMLEVHSAPKPAVDVAEARDWCFRALLTLFDMSYDCSGMPTEQGSLQGRLVDPVWPDLFAALIAYRADLRDQPGRLASRCDPLPVFLVSLLQSRRHEAWVAARWGESGDRGLARLEELTGPSEALDLDAWKCRLERLNALALLLAVRDPDLLLGWLDNLEEIGPLFFPVGRALFLRSSMASRIRDLLAPRVGPDLTPFQDLCLHVRPDLFLRFAEVDRVRSRVETCPSRYKAASDLISRTGRTVELPSPAEGACA